MENNFILFLIIFVTITSFCVGMIIMNNIDKDKVAYYEEIAKKCKSSLSDFSDYPNYYIDSYQNEEKTKNKIESEVPDYFFS